MPPGRPPSAEFDDPTLFEGSGFPARRITARLAWRAFRRHWWQALLLWSVGTSAVMALAYFKVKPTYDAFSTIKVDPGDRGLFRETNNAAVDFEVFKETQVKRVTNPNVIATALAGHPDLLLLPRLATAQDPEAEIRRSLAVAVIPKTNLIQVSMSSESASEAAAIVNAVIEAYLKVALDSTEEETEKRCRRLREVKEERTVAVRQKRDAIASLVKRIGTVDSNQARDRNSVTIEQYGVLTHQLLQADLELVEAQARLEQIQAEPAVAAPSSGDPSEPTRRWSPRSTPRPRSARLESGSRRLARPCSNPSGSPGSPATPPTRPPASEPTRPRSRSMASGPG